MPAEPRPALHSSPRSPGCANRPCFTKSEGARPVSLRGHRYARSVACYGNFPSDRRTTGSPAFPHLQTSPSSRVPRRLCPRVHVAPLQAARASHARALVFRLASARPAGFSQKAAPQSATVPTEESQARLCRSAGFGYLRLQAAHQWDSETDGLRAVHPVSTCLHSLLSPSQGPRGIPFPTGNGPPALPRAGQTASL